MGSMKDYVGGIYLPDIKTGEGREKMEYVLWGMLTAGVVIVATELFLEYGF